MGRVYTSGDQFSTDMIKDLFLKMYPLGSIYLSVNSTNPASLFGGTWERIKDRFLLAAGDTYAAGGTGGEATHKHTTQGHTLAESELPTITGYFDIRGWSDGQDIFATSGKFSNLGYAGQSSNQKMSYNNAKKRNVSNMRLVVMVRIVMVILGMPVVFRLILPCMSGREQPDSIAKHIAIWDSLRKCSRAMTCCPSGR